MSIETIVGNLCDAYKEVEAGSMLHSDALQAARVKDASLRSLSFYTADGEIYSLVNGVPHLAMTRERDNLVLRHLDDAVEQLRGTGNYRPSAEDVSSALAAKDTVHIDLTQLRLQGNDTEWRYLPISTQDYSSLNPEEKKLAERVHGSGDAFLATMKMLVDAGITETKIYVLNPEYVQVHATKGAIGRASWLSYINNYSSFIADNRSIDYSRRLRGVRRRASESELVAPGGRVAQDVDYFPLYQTILAHPEQAREALNDETASGLLTIVSSYYTNRKS